MYATPNVLDKILSQDYLFADFILLWVVNIDFVMRTSTKDSFAGTVKTLEAVCWW